MFSYTNRINYTNIIDWQFPNEKKYAIFQWIQDNLRKKPKTYEELREDLHRCFEKNGREALETTFNTTDPIYQTIAGRFKYKLKGRSISPLYYAFLSQNNDIFQLLLAEGASLDNYESFLTTPMGKLAHDYTEAKDGQFPNEDKYAIFQCIQDILKNKATLGDLHHCIQKNGREALEVAINIKNMEGPTVQSALIGPHNDTLKGRDVSPLHYAYLLGRVRRRSSLC